MKYFFSKYIWKVHSAAVQIVVQREVFFFFSMQMVITAQSILSLEYSHWGDPSLQLKSSQTCHCILCKCSIKYIHFPKQLYSHPKPIQCSLQQCAHSGYV